MSLPERIKRIEQRLAALDAVAFEWAGRLIIEVPGHVSAQHRDQLMEAMAHAGVDKAIVLDGGMKVARPTDQKVEEIRSSLARVEAKVDDLIAAISAIDDGGEDAGEEAAAIDLDGQGFGGERDQTQTL